MYFVISKLQKLRVILHSESWSSCLALIRSLQSAIKFFPMIDQILPNVSLGQQRQKRKKCSGSMAPYNDMRHIMPSIISCKVTWHVVLHTIKYVMPCAISCFAPCLAPCHYMSWITPDHAPFHAMHHIMSYAIPCHAPGFGCTMPCIMYHCHAPRSYPS